MIMTEQPENNDNDIQNMSADDFFKGNEPQPTPSFNPEDLAEQLKQNIGTPNGMMMIAQMILPMLPLPYRYKRNLTDKINSGQQITIVDILFGGISAGRVIRSVIGIIIFIAIAIFMSSRGLA
jgi:hypothetical protein